MVNASPKILGLILARGGSKSLPKKSIYPLAGKPLMYYTIKAAQGSRLINRLIITTDDPEMAEVARNHGVEVPFMRPKELAEDTTPDLPVFEHALTELKNREGYVPDVVVHLRPTTPLKSSEDIDRGIQIILDHPEADSVRSVCPPDHTPFKMGTVSDRGYYTPLLSKEFPEVFAKFREPYNMPRQALPEVWRHSGYVDVIRPATITAGHSMSGTKILPLFFDEWRNVDIDSMRELAHAEHLIKTHPRLTHLNLNADLEERMRKVKALILDGDGVVFTGRVFIHPERGELLKERSHIDGQGISLLRAAGVRAAFISGEATGFLENIGKKLNDLPSVKSGLWPPVFIAVGHQGKDKVTAAENWLARENIGWEECAAMGDDLSDIALLERAGLSACPANADPYIRERVHFVAARVGGDGAIRDFANEILKAKGLDPRHLALR